MSILCCIPILPYQVHNLQQQQTVRMYKPCSYYMLAFIPVPGTYVLLCINVYFYPSAFFSLPTAGLFSCSRLRGTQGARPNITAQVSALTEIRGTCSGGSKWQVPTGRHSEHVEPSRPMQAHLQVKKMSDGSCDIYCRILNVVDVVRH